MWTHRTLQWCASAGRRPLRHTERRLSRCNAACKFHTVPVVVTAHEHRRTRQVFNRLAAGRHRAWRN